MPVDPPATSSSFWRLVLTVVVPFLVVAAILTIFGEQRQPRDVEPHTDGPAVEPPGEVEEAGGASRPGLEKLAAGLEAIQGAEPSNTESSAACEGDNCMRRAERPAYVPSCGDGTVDPGEECDVYKPHQKPDDGCTEDCTLEPEACEQCTVAYCSNVGGVVDAVANCLGPGHLACAAVIDCARRTGCAADRPWHCYCGSNHDIRSCSEHGGDGACRDEIESAHGTSDPKAISEHFIDQYSEGGSAGFLLHCQQTWCREACLVPTQAHG